MYQYFFGFKERPFKLVPDPDYLYLSASHKEALAHLRYALKHGDGFVKITGEVGTGKTTLCRAFLETLDEDTEAAYIFNPRLDPIELIKAINDEFGIDSASYHLKTLIDALNAFLIEQKQKGKNSILLIDEAQNLPPDVLEQLRLLSNLETTREKLLQIILVGQPELGQLLATHALRQLAQRITLSCRLRPLNFWETQNYIQHRIQVASLHSGVVFDSGALRAIHRYAKGIPRRINIVCDRALLTAFGLDQKRITAAIAGKAVAEISGKTPARFGGWLKWAALAAALAVFGTAGFWMHRTDTTRIESSSEIFPSPSPAVASKVLEPDADAVSSANTEPPAAPAETRPTFDDSASLAAWISGIDFRASRYSALENILSLWDSNVKIRPYLDEIANDADFFQTAAGQHDLKVQALNWHIDKLAALNLPAVIELKLPTVIFPHYLSLEGFDDSGRLVCGGVGERILIAPEALAPFRTGYAYVFWKDFFAYQGTVSLNSGSSAIVSLKMNLKQIGFSDIDMTPFYDAKTRQAIVNIQKHNGIPVDGLVGPLTQMVLYNHTPSLPIPRLRPNLPVQDTDPRMEQKN